MRYGGGVSDEVSDSVLSAFSGTELLTDAHGLDAAGVAWHYGDPLGEQRRIHSSGAVVDRSHRTVIRVEGKDAAEFLNNLLTQKLDDVPDEFTGQALDLDIQGRILHHTDIYHSQGVFYLDFPSPQAETFVDFLQKMIFWSEVTITVTDLAILSILGTELPQGIEAEFIRHVGWPVLRTDIAVTDPVATIKKLNDASVPLVGLMAYTAERVRAGEPELGVDLDARSIPHEIPTLIGRDEHIGAVHLNKGCYRGQETVARVENLGRSPRVLVLVHLDGSAPVDPHPGLDIISGTRSVGRLGTVIHDCDYGPIALSLIKRSALEKDDLHVVAEDGHPVALNVDKDSLPEDEGPKAGREAIERLRGGH